MTKDEANKLLAENAALRAENQALRAELAAVNHRLDALLGLSASQNQQIGELADMMRRRLQRAPKNKDDDPDDPPPGGAGGSVEAPERPDKPRRKRGRAGRREGQSRKKSGRNSLPEHLPVEDEEHSPDCCAHCGSDKLLCRDTETVEKLDAVKAHIRRRRITREVKVCACCRRTTTATMPPMPRKRSGYTCEFLAWLVVQKFVLLVPLDRIRRILESQGIHVSMGTLVSLVELASDLLGPIDGQHWKELLAGAWLALDATGLKTLVPWLPVTWLGFLDVFTREELTVYMFSMTKHGDELASKLARFDGTVLCDAESRHNELLLRCAPRGMTAGSALRVPWRELASVTR